MAMEMADLGFSQIELSHGIRIVLVPGLLKAIEERVISVVSTHNFCPLPAGISQAAPNLFEPSSRYAREREQWLRHTKRSIEFAAQVGAGSVVCHLGGIDFFWTNPAERLRRWIDAQGSPSAYTHPRFASRRDQVMERIRKRLPLYWDPLIDSIKRIEPLAREKKVRLGFENRERLEELPIDSDFGLLFETLGPDSTGGYWHDTGHAELKQRHGLIDHRKHLDAWASRLIGFHLHDVNAAGVDHQPVGTGSVDFEMISSYWRPHHTLVLELSPGASPGEVVESRQRIESLLVARGFTFR
ncbi:MAG: sugar phosphate isomerase/epimerase [Opitutaceae bacterium]|nr:sugar phosphate isomerase/epimerase [Opitutaceae bacterium]